MSIYISPSEKTYFDEHHFKFESWYLPDKERDHDLYTAGFEICVFTEYKKSKLKNKIIFRCNNQEWSIDCIHVIVGRITFDSNEIISEKDQYVNNPPYLSPEDNFFVMKSYIEALISFGIQETIYNSFKTELDGQQHIIGFNHLTRAQFLAAIANLVPNIFKKILLFLLETLYISSPDTFRSNLLSPTPFIWKHYYNAFYDVILHEKLSNELISQLYKEKKIKIPNSFFLKYQKEK